MKLSAVSEEVFSELSGRDDAIAALLSVASLRPVDTDIAWKFTALSRALLQGEKALAAIALTQAGLPGLANDEAADALALAAESLAQGVNPATLLKWVGLARDRKAVAKFDPNEPRDDHGRWTSSAGAPTIEA